MYNNPVPEEIDSPYYQAIMSQYENNRLANAAQLENAATARLLHEQEARKAYLSKIEDAKSKEQKLADKAHRALLQPMIDQKKATFLIEHVGSTDQDWHKILHLIVAQCEMEFSELQYQNYLSSQNSCGGGY